MRADTERSAHAPVRRKTSFWVRLLALCFLASALLGWLRCGQAVASWRVLNEMGFWPGPLYLALTGAAWGVVGLLAGAGLWFSTAFSRGFARLAAVFLPATFWADRAWFSGAADRFSNGEFLLGATAIWLVFAFWTLSRRTTRRSKSLVK